VRMMDPFGLCELPRSFASIDTLVVTPAIRTLPPVRLTGEWVGSGLSTARSIAAAGEDDTATREYRHGDDLRRIHWRTTARRGELTVRHEEQPWQSRGAVLLDSRSVAHRGEGPASSFEWAVSAAASVAVHLCRSGFTMRLVSDNGHELSSAGRTATSFRDVVVDALAVIEPSHRTDLSIGAATMRRDGSEGLVVAVLGALTLAEAEQLTRMRSGTSSVGVAVLLDTASWTSTPAVPGPRSSASYPASRELLTAAGWRVLEVRRGDALTDVWSRAGMATSGVRR
jgi:uncharacterized protein (DUF58 family)